MAKDRGNKAGSKNASLMWHFLYLTLCASSLKPTEARELKEGWKEDFVGRETEKDVIVGHPQMPITNLMQVQVEGEVRET